MNTLNRPACDRHLLLSHAPKGSFQERFESDPHFTQLNCQGCAWQVFKFRPVCCQQHRTRQWLCLESVLWQDRLPNGIDRVGPARWICHSGNGQATDSLPLRRAAPSSHPSYHQNKPRGHLPAGAVLGISKPTRHLAGFLFLGS